MAGPPETNRAAHLTNHAPRRLLRLRQPVTPRRGPNPGAGANGNTTRAGPSPGGFMTETFEALAFIARMVIYVLVALVFLRIGLTALIKLLEEWRKNN